MTSQTNIATETLRTLHRIRRQLDDLNERLQRGPRVVRAHQANVERMEAELQKLRDEARAVRMATDDKQNQLASGETSVAKRRQQLQAASSNREFQALRDEIAAVEKTNEVLEVEILEAIDKLDGYDRRIDEAVAAVAKARLEVMARVWADQRGARCTVLRPSVVVGPETGRWLARSPGLR